MLEIPTPEQASRLKAFFDASGYTEQSIAKLLGSAIPPPLQARPKALYLTRDHSLVNNLLRLFFLSESVSLADARAKLDDWFVDFCLRQCSPDTRGKLPVCVGSADLGEDGIQ